MSIKWLVGQLLQPSHAKFHSVKCQSKFTQIKTYKIYRKSYQLKADKIYPKHSPSQSSL